MFPKTRGPTCIIRRHDGLCSRIHAYIFDPSPFGAPYEIHGTWPRSTSIRQVRQYFLRKIPPYMAFSAATDIEDLHRRSESSLQLRLSSCLIRVIPRPLGRPDIHMVSHISHPHIIRSASAPHSLDMLPGRPRQHLQHIADPGAPSSPLHAPITLIPAPLPSP
jgi:hypothetical protein